MTLWGMLLVEFVYPMILRMHADGTAFQDCPDCLRATSSAAWSWGQRNLKDSLGT